jgi:hypothetical protein
MKYVWADTVTSQLGIWLMEQRLHR